MLQQYLINIDARLRSRNSTISVKAETAECLVARDSIIAWCLYKRIKTFHVNFEKFRYTFQIRVDFYV